MLENAIRAAKLDVDFYNTVEHDPSYTSQAAWVVVIVNAIVGVGLSINFGGNVVAAVISTVVFGLIGWLIWSGLTLNIGTKVFEGTADFGEMIRVLGFAQAPLALVIIPIIGLIAPIWALVAGVVAVREGLDFSTLRAIGTVAIGWVAMLVLQSLLFRIFS